jgi:hypothetical protein
MDIYQTKRLVMHFFRTMFNSMGIPFELPQDIIDGPNRNPNTGVSMPSGAAGSTSDPNRAPQEQPPAQPNAIKTIDAVQPATLNPEPKQASDEKVLSIGGAYGDEKPVSAQSSLIEYFRKNFERV